MTRVSRFKVKDEVLEKLFDLFFTVISQTKNKQTFNSVILDLLSPKERIMMAKRIAIMYLLAKNINHRIICNVLKVSSATVSKFQVVVERSEGIVPIFQGVIKNEKIKMFLEEVFNTLYGPGVYGTNWKAGWERKIDLKRRKQTGL